MWFISVTTEYIFTWEGVAGSLQILDQIVPFLNQSAHAELVRLWV